MPRHICLRYGSGQFKFFQRNRIISENYLCFFTVAAVLIIKTAINAGKYFVLGTDKANGFATLSTDLTGIKLYNDTYLEYTKSIKLLGSEAKYDGTITQEHADWLLEGLEKGFLGGPGGFGPGDPHVPGFGPRSDEAPTTQPTQPGG